MSLTSPVFLFLFLPVVLVLHLALPEKTKNPFLLLASVLFYCWGDGFSVFVLAASVTVNYLFGLAVQKAGAGRQGKAVLITAVAGNLLLLFTFKYLRFALANLGHLGIIRPESFDFSGWQLPLGISFFTFAAVAYLADVYRSKTGAEQSFIDFGLYLSLFPKVIAGPIVRYSEVAQELKGRQVGWEDFACGVRRFVIGLGKKVLIANPLAAVADEAFKAPDGIGMATAWLGILCYTLQIYCDFSGYSDMAIGLGRMFGFTFGENFNYPYISQSIQEFWRRWHISLSSWLRDYLYIPLGGSRRSGKRTYFNLSVVFLLCGLWHGANWTFIVWGLYYGAFLMLERTGFGRALQRSGRAVRHLYALLVVMIGWVPFRAEDLSQALHYLRAMFSFEMGGFDYFYMTFVSRQFCAALAAGIIACMPVARLPEHLRQHLERSGAAARLLRLYDWNLSAAAVVLLIAVFVAAVMQLAVSTYSPFIYTKF